MKILHLSDLHLRDGWYEEQGAVLDAFVKDLKLRLSRATDPWLILSGDFVQAGGDQHFFVLFEAYLDPILRELNIPEKRRIFVPGNHDISRDGVRMTTQLALAERPDDEATFNNHVYTEYRDILFPKFASYFLFEAKLASYGCGEASFGGSGHDVGDGVGVYTLNTALFSFGGVPRADGRPIDDSRLLRIETRRLNRWLQETEFKYRILVMHHPAVQMVDWAKTQLDQLANRSFDLVLQDHVHRSDARYFQTGSGRAVICTAPALFTRKG